MKLRVLGELTRKCVPGDIITVGGQQMCSLLPAPLTPVAPGMFLPAPFQGFRAMRAGLTADVYLEVTASFVRYAFF